jgi:hypothetical protein
VTESEPTDEEIAARLAGNPAKRWRELFELIDSLGELDGHISWVAPVQTGPKEFIAGYPVYSDAFNAIHALLYELDVVVPFNWPEWSGQQLYPHGDGLDSVAVAEAARLCTVYLRGERFSDGAIGQALRDGTFDRIFKRLRTWFDSESGLVGSTVET